MTDTDSVQGSFQRSNEQRQHSWGGRRRRWWGCCPETATNRGQSGLSKPSPSSEPSGDTGSSDPPPGTTAAVRADSAHRGCPGEGVTFGRSHIWSHGLEGQFNFISTGQLEDLSLVLHTEPTLSLDPKRCNPILRQFFSFLQCRSSNLGLT